MKKGQVTVFIIIGIIIVLAIGIVLYLYSRTPAEVESKLGRFQTGTVQERVNAQVANCLSRAAGHGAYAIGLHGGYLSPAGILEYGEPGDGFPIKSHYFAEQMMLPYGLDFDTVLLRPKEDMVKVLENYIMVEFEDCADFSSFEEEGFSVTRPDIPWEVISFNFSRASVPYSSKKVNSSVTLTDEFILVELTYPFSLQRAEEKFYFDDFNVKVPLRLGPLYDFAERFVNDAAGQSYDFFEHCDEFKSGDEMVNVYFISNPYRQNYAVRFVDAQPVLKGQLPLRFQFAIKNVEVSGECVG